jgi:hypothetical protein
MPAVKSILILKEQSYRSLLGIEADILLELVLDMLIIAELFLKRDNLDSLILNYATVKYS